MGKTYFKKLNGFTILKNKPVAIEFVINRLDEKPLFDKRTEMKLKKLKRIYQRVPTTKCRKCGECCHWYIVNNVFSIEYLNISRYIKEKFTPEEITKFCAFAKINLGMQQRYSGNTKRPKKWRACIFLDEQNKTCKIYEVRPLVCRLWGLNYENSSRKKSKAPCSDVTLLDKKDKKLLSRTILNSLWKEIGELPDYFIFDSKQGTLITKSQDINNWFLI